MPFDVGRFREEAEAFLRDLDEEFYLHKAGRKQSLELEAIYATFPGLATLGSARALGELVAAGRPLVDLWRYACEEYLESVVQDEREEVSRLEGTLEAEVDGTKIPYQMLYSEISDESDRQRRVRLEQSRLEILDRHLNAPLARVANRRAAEIPNLGSRTELELYRRFGLDVTQLAASGSVLLAQTQELYEGAFGAIAERRLGLRLGEMARHDVTRLWRAPEWDPFLPQERMLPALGETLADLGIDLGAQPNIELDVEDRPTKRPRPFCAPIDVPDRVMLVLKPIGGVEDWRGLFHEAGHAEQFAHIRSTLPVEAKKLGDYAVSEGFAFLLELLVDDTEWLRRRGMDAEGLREFVRESAVMRLYLVRRYCGKLLYEIELNGGGDLSAMPQRYHDHYQAAISVDSSPAEYLSDVDPRFYGSAYLRAWAFEAQLSAHLTERFGPGWFASKGAGSFLRELWAGGQSLDANALIAQVTGKPLDLLAISDRIRSRLA